MRFYTVTYPFKTLQIVTYWCNTKEERHLLSEKVIKILLPFPTYLYDISFFFYTLFSSVAQSCLTLCDPMNQKTEYGGNHENPAVCSKPDLKELAKMHNNVMFLTEPFEGGVIFHNNF